MNQDMDNGRYAKVIYEMEVEGTKGRGRSKKRWTERVKVLE